MKTMIRYVILAILVVKTALTLQAQDTLHVFYQENYPYAYTENNTLKGIEIDILKEYVQFMKDRKQIHLIVSYKPYKEFINFYNDVKNADKNCIGLGSVTYTQEREKEIDFSPFYLKNKPVLVTDGQVATIKEKNASSITNVLSGLSALTVDRTSHVNYLNELKKEYLPGLKMTLVSTQNQVLDEIIKNPKTFGYVDIITYWNFIKKNPDKFLKIQRVFTQPSEHFGIIMPKKENNHKKYLTEFFETGFGFTSTKRYNDILSNYLGYEIIETVQVN